MDDELNNDFNPHNENLCSDSKIDIEFNPRDERVHYDDDFENDFKPRNEDELDKIIQEKDKKKYKKKIWFKKVDNNLIIKSFPIRSRITICEEIYKKLEKNEAFSNSQMTDSIIKELKIKSPNQDWIKKLPINELREIRNKLSCKTIDRDTHKSFSNYFGDLTNLVKELRDLNINKRKINFSEISRNLIKRNKGLNLSKRGLEESVARIFNHLKNEFDEFNLERKKNKAVSGTESEKESVRCLRKELKLIFELDNGKYEGKCSNPNCHTNFKRLPAIDFHHNDPRIKTSEWSDIMHKDYDTIKTSLESQKVKPICKNCHLTENAKIYSEFKDIISKKNLFKYSSKEIGELINKRTKIYRAKTKTNYSNSSLKIEVFRWIKKRSVIEQLSNGKCTSCEEKRLPALQAHHTNPDLKIHKWGQISRSWNIRDLMIKFLIKEECVFLCGNCHSMINSKNFENNISRIIGERHKNEIRQDYREIRRKIGISMERIKRIKYGSENQIIVDHLKDK